MTALLNKKQVAGLFGVSVKTVDGWVLNKKIPYIKPGGKLVRFRQIDMENYLERRTVKARS